MNKDNITRLKKYLFYISIFFLILTTIHFTYIYLYLGAKKVPLKGGDISEGFIGEMPHLNPLKFNSGYNKDINSLLYRSLMTYDNKQKKIVSDLANCDISNLAYIKCYLGENIIWSNGENITIDDVISTYKFLKTGNINPYMTGLLENVTIENSKGVITFSNNKKDINFLNILLQPIVPKKVIENSGDNQLYGAFSHINGIFSGKYIADNINYDDVSGINKLILVKNTKYPNNDVNIEKLVFKFFKDIPSFVKHKDIINTFLDKKGILGKSVSRLENNQIYLPKYTSLFINTKTLQKKKIRSFLLDKIDRNKIIKALKDSSYIPIYNPYITEENIDRKSSDNNLTAMVKDLGYFPKSEILEKLINSKKDEKNKSNFDEINKKLSLVTSPVKNIHNFVTNDNILIKGGIKDNSPDEIWINNYKLKSYKKGAKTFLYRLKEAFKNIKKGANKYDIYFVENGKKELKETFNIYYDDDNLKLEKQKTDLIASFKKDSNNKSIENESINELESKIKNLKDVGFYDTKLNPFVIKLYYIDSSQDNYVIANYIKNELEVFGLIIDITPISASDLNKEIISGKKDYDMIVAGIDLGYFNHNIFPFFHSSQVNRGLNFSNINKISLDIKLEDLKSSLLNSSEILKQQASVLKILREEQVIKTLYSKPITYLVDKGINGFNLEKNIPNESKRFSSLNTAYVNYESNINFKEKSIVGFIGFILKLFK